MTKEEIADALIELAAHIKNGSSSLKQEGNSITADLEGRSPDEIEAIFDAALEQMFSKKKDE